MLVEEGVRVKDEEGKRGRKVRRKPREENDCLLVDRQNPFVMILVAEEKSAHKIRTKRKIDIDLAYLAMCLVRCQRLGSKGSCIC